MNIIVGAHGTGKTTLCNELYRLDSSLYVTDGFSRPILSIKNKIGLTDLQVQILNSTFMMHFTEMYIKYKYVFSTRSLIDTIAFTELLYPELDIDDVKTRLIEIRDAGLITNIFYLPIEFPLIDDGIRYSDPEFQKKYDEKIREIITRYSLYYDSITGTVEKRAKTVLDIYKCF